VARLRRCPKYIRQKLECFVSRKITEFIAGTFNALATARFDTWKPTARPYEHFVGSLEALQAEAIAIGRARWPGRKEDFERLLIGYHPLHPCAATLPEGVNDQIEGAIEALRVKARDSESERLAAAASRPSRRRGKGKPARQGSRKAAPAEASAAPALPIAEADPPPPPLPPYPADVQPWPPPGPTPPPSPPEASSAQERRDPPPAPPPIPADAEPSQQGPGREFEKTGPIDQGSAEAGKSQEDLFVTNEQREAAIEAATQQLGTAKAVADKAKVTYTELRSWVRGRHEEFSKKGESRRARMIEDALRSLVSGSGHTRS
jgi:hypothetical protein